LQDDHGEEIGKPQGLVQSRAMFSRLVVPPAGHGWPNCLAVPSGLSAEPVHPKAARKAKGGTQSAKGAPTKGKATKKATPAKNAPQGRRAAKTQEATAPREGSKTAQVVTMLQRKNGATLAEIMEKMSWQKHTVRGFMAGAMRKAGYTVESFKPEGGERTYRINK
jgi:hypothetical protein